MNRSTRRRSAASSSGRPEAVKPRPTGHPPRETASQDPGDRDLPADRPEHPTLRANSYPEVSNLFCRLPLPTFFHQLEAVHLGDLLRLWVRPDVRIPDRGRVAPLDFQGPSSALRTPQSCGALPAERPPLRLTRFRGPPLSQGCQGEERTPPRANAGVSRFVYVAVVNPPPPVPEY